MKSKILFAAGLSCFVANTPASAVSIWLDPGRAEATVGEIVRIDIYWDFTKRPVVGGGFDVTYDASVLEYVDWDWSTIDFTFDRSISRKPSVYTGESEYTSGNQGLLDGLSLNDFNDISGGKAGTLLFRAVGSGISELNLFPDATYGEDWGGEFAWAELGTGKYGTVSVGFSGSTVTVSAVPVPAALWLFGSGLAGLAGVASRRRSAAS